VSTVGQVIADPDFAKLSPQDQQGVLTHFDPGFGKISPTELPAVIAGIQGKQSTASGPSPARKVGNITIPAGVEKSGNQPIPSPEGILGTTSDYNTEGKDLSGKDLAIRAGAMGVGAGAGAVAQVAAAPFAAGAASTAAAAGPKLVDAAQEEIPAAGEKAKAAYPMFKSIFDALGAGEMAGAQAESSAWKDVMDNAYEAAAEASHQGNKASAAIYTMGANAAKAMSTAHTAYVASGNATRGAIPAAVALWMYFDFARDVYRGATEKVKELTSDDEK
jgi:hypothetical protein